MSLNIAFTTAPQGPFFPSTGSENAWYLSSEIAVFSGKDFFDIFIFNHLTNQPINDFWG